MMIRFIVAKPVEKVAFDLLEEECGPLIWPQITEQQKDIFDIP